MYSLISLLSGIFPLPAIHSLHVTLYVMEYINYPDKREIFILHKSLTLNTSFRATVLDGKNIVNLVIS